MSLTTFSAKSIEMHPQFEGDGYLILKNLMECYPDLYRAAPSEYDCELKSLLQKREATFRHFLPAHITTSVVVLSPDEMQTLLLFHNKIREWVYPGGHADGDWHLLRSALRECFEETSLESVSVLPPREYQSRTESILCPHFFQKFSIPSVGQEPEHVHFDAVFVVRATNLSHVFHNPTESMGHQWISRDDLEHHSRRRPGLVVDGLDSLTAQICLRAMQGALGGGRVSFSEG